MAKNRGKRKRETGLSPAEKSAASGKGSVEIGFPIVGIGASAGGLDAFKKFFSAMPADSGMAFVLIPHLDPKHKSLMAELIAKHTPMPVREAEEGMPVAANHIYVIPPNRYLSISRGVLHFTQPADRPGLPPAIDPFFRSLAHDQKEKAIGIILSGTGSSGVLGLKEIKLVGGLVMAQDPQSAEYDQMPRNAILTRIVDFVLPPEEMPEALMKYVAHPYLNHAEPVSPAELETADRISEILAVLWARTQHDFRHYRSSMVMRRIERRMGLCHMDDMAVYLQHLRNSPGETAALCKDLLIGVTGFFRDPEAFEVLEQQVIPEIVSRHEDDAPVRVWVPGCATGEEAYSIAMLLLEEFARQKKLSRFQIFASDIDEESLASARAGVYPETIMQDIPPKRLERFFVNADEHFFRVTKPLREPIVFAPQNVISDAPFSNLDLISCRNLLIYLEPEIQEKIISLFHYSLNAKGFLFLGPSESIGRRAELFETVSKKWRIYRSLSPKRREQVEIPILPPEECRYELPAVEPPPNTGRHFANLAQQALLAEYAPAAVLIDYKYEALYYFGPTTNYLEFPPGEPTKDLLALARPGLRTKIQAACHQVICEDATVVDDEARVERDGRSVPCLITVKSVTEPRQAAKLLLVTFRDREDAPITKISPAGPTAGEESNLVNQLKYELKTTRESLRSTIEEFESSNEELRASNEEVMSMNEELRSVNEELQASKEELQSLNEELTNLLTLREIAIIFLDREFCIRRFSPASAKLFNLMTSDIGRPLSDLAMQFTDAHLLNDCRHVLDRLTPAEAEVSTKDGRCYLRRILPYRTTDDHIEGVGITFIDITDRKRTEESLRENEARLKAIVNTAVDAIITIDERGIIDSVNPAAERMFGYPLAELIGHNVKMLMPPPYCDEHDGYLKHYLETGEAKIIGVGRELVGRRKDGSTFPLDLAVSELHDKVGMLFTGIIRNITERKAEHERLIQSERLAALGEAMTGLAHESRNALARSEANLQRLARRLTDSPELLAMIQGAQRANDDIRRQFEEVREYSAPLTIQLESLDLRQMIRQAWEHLAAERGDRTAELQIAESCIDANCKVDEFSMSNAFRNILDNALAACDDPVGIDVGFSEARIGKRPAVQVSIRDHGPGVSPEIAERAFDAFFTTKTRGTGLGLAIVKRTIEAHDGRVEFRAPEGRGAEVVITLPRNPV